MKAVVAAFNQEKALVGAFSVITNLRMEPFEALVQVRAVRAGVAETRRMVEIVTRNKEAQAAATRLRREVAQLLDEAVRLGLVSEEAAGAEQSQVAGELTQSPAS